MTSLPESFTAFQATMSDDGVERGITAFAAADLPTEGVLIDVAWSSVNYKDALATVHKGRVAEISPLVPGIDLAGTVVESDDPSFSVGDDVVAHGYATGTGRHGGYAEYARVPADELVALPAALSPREAMVIGTAGFTAALSVVQLEEHGVTPDAGPVVVTGATGGVGSTAVTLLAGRGYDVIASTGKADAAAYLKGLGATSIIDRAELSDAGRPLQKPTWAAAVDCVGGITLANVLARTDYGGAVAASGLTGGAELPSTVMPFILRGVALLGIDSVQTPIDRRRAVWERLGGDLKPAGLADIGHDITLGDLEGVLTEILKGGVTGRCVVDLRGS